MLPLLGLCREGGGGMGALVGHRWCWLCLCAHRLPASRSCSATDGSCRSRRWLIGTKLPSSAMRDCYYRWERDRGLQQISWLLLPPSKWTGKMNPKGQGCKRFFYHEGIVCVRLAVNSFNMTSFIIWPEGHCSHQATFISAGDFYFCKEHEISSGVEHLDASLR